MVAHHSVGMVAVDVTRILVKDVLGFALVAGEQHEHDDGEKSAGAGGQVGDVVAMVLLHGSHTSPLCMASAVFVSTLQASSYAG